MRKASMKGLFVVATALAWPMGALAADTLLVNGHIYTGNKGAPWATALAIEGARIEAVGSREQVSKRRRSPRAGHRPEGSYGDSGHRRLAYAFAFRGLCTAWTEFVDARVKHHAG